MDNDIYKKGLIVVGVIAVVLITFFGYKLSQKQEALEIQSMKKEIESLEVENEKPNPATDMGSNLEQEQTQKIVIDIAGAVVNPGVYTLDLGSRLIDAINSAGGLSKDADYEYVSKYLNKSRIINDAEKIYIPLMSDDLSTLDSLTEEVGTSDNNIVNDDNVISSRVNINTASKEQLMSLKGIGDVYSDRIIEYRNNQPFKAIDEIKNVKGIGEKTFDKIKDYITVN